MKRQSMRAFKIICLFAACLVFTPLASAQDDVDTGFEKRLELARSIQELRPAREQIESAITRYTARMPARNREVISSALRGVFNYKALEKISIDAYAEVYSEAELQAMLDYYSKPEAQSAADKTDNYAEIVYPEIIRMLDRAMMQVKTGGTSPQ